MHQPHPCPLLDRRLQIAGADRAGRARVERELGDIAGRSAWDALPSDPATLELASTQDALRQSQTMEVVGQLTGPSLAFARRQALKPEVFAACDSVRARHDRHAGPAPRGGAGPHRERGGTRTPG